MAEIINELPIELWAGQNNEQYYGDDMQNYPFNQYYGYPEKFKYNSNVNYPNPYPSQSPRTGTIRNNIPSAGVLEKILNQANNNNANNTQMQTASGGFNASEFFAQNKWLVLGGAAIVGYFLFFGAGGGGLAESTVIKRFNKR